MRFRVRVLGFVAVEAVIFEASLLQAAPSALSGGRWVFRESCHPKPLLCALVGFDSLPLGWFSAVGSTVEHELCNRADSFRGFRV